jgi:hypothetical protein
MNNSDKSRLKEVKKSLEGEVKTLNSIITNESVGNEMEVIKIIEARTKLWVAIGLIGECLKPT